MSQTSWWDKVRTGSKKGFDYTWRQADKLGAPVNKLTNKLGSEAFWPTTLDLESDKAARILKSFCKDGFYAEEEIPSVDGPKQKQKVAQKIPAKVIQNAKGLAIFTTMRTGLWTSGAGGSGILLARLPDGSWSPPSGILLHTAGLGFLVGVDIYDCVMVINTEEALQAFTKIRCTLGSEISVAAGPVGAGGILETELHKRRAPIYNYMKSRGFYAGVQIDGTIIIERTDENERFYGERIPVRDILAGKVRHPPYELRRLMETIKAAQGDTNYDASALPTEPPPGDYVVDDGQMFGIPVKDDPDPYGVMALEKEGLSLKEAATHKRASWQEFSFAPSPTSPVHAVYARSNQDRSADASRRNSWRTSAFASDSKRPSSLRNSIDQQSVTSPMVNDSASASSSTLSQQYDELHRELEVAKNHNAWLASELALARKASTQTDVTLGPPSPSRRSTRSGISRAGSRRSSDQQGLSALKEGQVLDTSPERKEPGFPSKDNGYSTPPHTPPMRDGQQDEDETAEPDDESDEDVQFEEPIVHSVQAVQPVSPSAISKVRIVTVPKRITPILPPRNPNRSSGPLVIDASPITTTSEQDLESPAKSSHDDETIQTTDFGKTSDSSSDQPAELDHVIEKLDDVQLGDKKIDPMDDVKLDDEEDEMPDPWKKIEAARQRDSVETERQPHSTDSMPGGFD